jgi:hypothetical protein
MKFKKGDIVKLSKKIEQSEMEGRRYRSESLPYNIGKRIFNHHFNNVIPPYLAKGVGRVTKVERIESESSVVKGVYRKSVAYQVYFLFGIDVGKKYISYHKDWFMEDELEKADEKEREFFTNLMEIIEAKEVAESL